MLLIRKKINSEFHNMLSVDPGYVTTGWAYWREPSLFLPSTDTFTNIHGTEEDIWVRLYYMSEVFDNLLAALQPRLCIVEGVNLWGASATSQAGATQGYTFNLASLVGMFILRCKDKRIPVETTFVTEWKGNLDNDALDFWIEKLNGQKYPEHIREAVGIGFWKQGVLQ